MPSSTAARVACKRVFDAGLLFFHFDFGRRADVDNRDAADQFGQALLKLLAVVIGSGLVDLGADLLDPAFEIGLLAGAVDDGRVVLVDDDTLGAAKIGQGDVVELDAKFFGDQLAAGEDGDIFEHRFAAVAEAGGLDGHTAQGAANLVDHQSRQGFAFDVFGDDDERLAGLGDLLEDRAGYLSSC